MSGKPDSVYVPQGTFEISARPSVCFATVLGSCVAACLWDAHRGVGGMNHLLLPPAAQDGEGVHLMELLINALLKNGARKTNLRAKLFGGARMIDGMSDIGGRNADFAREFFRYEDIEIVSESLGGRSARRIEFWPVTGHARQRLVSTEAVELPGAAPSARRSTGGEIDLF